MATKTFIGNVGLSGTATGPHIHQYIKDLQTNQYIDPRTLQSPLLDVRVGEKEVPLAIKNAQGQIIFNPAAGATVTSEFGPRSAPKAGASTDHKGRDIALPYGTPVKYTGAGQYVPETGVQGFGNLGKIITPDKRYEIGFGHMSSLGQPTTGTSTAPGTLTDASYQDSQQRTKDLLEAFMYGAKFGGGYAQSQPTAQSFADQMKTQMLQSMLAGGTQQAFIPNYGEIDRQLVSAIYG